MRLANSIEIAASAHSIYALASATERWPALLPHYRYVRVLDNRGDERIVEMAARRDFIPVRWHALQRNDERTPSIYFRHLSGWTRGMHVEWQFEQMADRTRVTIVHDLVFSFPIASAWIGRHIVGSFFVEGIANRTLACFKRIAEGGTS